MDAIVYESNTGTTERYAKLLSEQTGVPALRCKEALKQLKPGADVVFLGWLCAGKIKGYQQAKKRFTLQAVGAVGMGNPTEKIMVDMVRQNGVSLDILYYLPGALDWNKLRGKYRFMMNCAKTALIGTIRKKEIPGPDDEEMIHMIEHGGDHFDAHYLDPIAAVITGK